MAATPLRLPPASLVNRPIKLFQELVRPHRSGCAVELAGPYASACWSWRMWIETSTSLDDNPTGFAGGRRDRRRYPRMVCADVTPQGTSGTLYRAPSLQNMPLNISTRNQLAAITEYCGDWIRTAFTVEATVTSPGYACR